MHVSVFDRPSTNQFGNSCPSSLTSRRRGGGPGGRASGRKKNLRDDMSQGVVAPIPRPAGPLACLSNGRPATVGYQINRPAGSGIILLLMRIGRIRQLVTTTTSCGSCCRFRWLHDGRPGRRDRRLVRLTTATHFGHTALEHGTSNEKTRTHTRGKKATRELGRQWTTELHPSKRSSPNRSRRAERKPLNDPASFCWDAPFSFSCGDYNSRRNTHTQKKSIYILFLLLCWPLPLFRSLFFHPPINPCV